MKRLILAVLVASSFAVNAADNAVLKVIADAAKTPLWNSWVEYKEEFSKSSWVFNINPDYKYNSPQVKEYKLSQVYKDFKSNEIKAKKLYGEHPFFVPVTIKEIGYDAFKETRVSASVSDFDNVFFKGIPEDKLMNLEAGQKIGLICQGGDFIAIIPVIKNCQLSQDYIKSIPSNVPANITVDNVGANLQTTDLLFTYIAMRTAYGAEKFDKMDAGNIDKVWSEIALRPKSKISRAMAEAGKHLNLSLSQAQKEAITEQLKANDPEGYANINKQH
ncbi:hypothetical protein [Citrobacter enshiensis]|uniref:hypothetical protein n=1 Tax=Citrobacter enshiensis TaxID=2971264 RepID=UPI0023E8F9D0|nr:hypothetical protein [Citrobacter enshiensis]WET42167.1 hypothetical protein P2W74_08125 [Citrobacter enshiensis]